MPAMITDEIKDLADKLGMDPQELADALATQDDTPPSPTQRLRVDRDQPVPMGGDNTPLAPVGDTTGSGALPVQDTGTGDDPASQQPAGSQVTTNLPPNISQQLDALKPPAPEAGPSSVTNPDQGLGDISQDVPPTGVFTTPPTSVRPSPPISTDNSGLLAGATIPIPPANLPPTQQPGLLSKAVTDYGQQARQLVSGAVSSATAAPFDAAGAVAALASLATGSQGARSFAEGSKGIADQMREGAKFATGAGEPSSAGQLLAKAVGTHASPNILMSAGMTTADLLSQAITPAAAEPAMSRTEANIVLAKPGDMPNVAPQAVVRVTHTIPTAGGPAKVSDGDFKLMGLMGAVTLGAIFAPAILKAVRSNPLPTYRPVANAPTGVLALSNPMDLARTYDDANAGILRIARRAGMDPQALQKVQDTFQIQTGGAARNLVNSAITVGEMQTPTFSFTSKVPLTTLARADSPQVRDYLHARDTFDDILQKEAALVNKGKNAVAQQAAIGPIQVRGMTRNDALNTINAMEAADPSLKQVAVSYNDIVKQMRDFNAKGEYAIVSKKELTKLNQTSKNYVPWKTDDGQVERVFDNVQGDRVSPFASLSSEMQSSMRFRLENEARGQYIDAMRKINPDFFKKVTAEELSQNKNWKPNTVKVYRKGKPQYYVGDPFIADVLNLEPYAVGGALSQTLYATKRFAESGATGLLAPWFSVTSALRSWQIGKITTGQGLKPPTLLGMTRAVPQQLYPQLAKEIAARLESTSGGWLPKVLGRQASQALSIKLADAYDRSFYAQLEAAGTHKGSFLQHQAQLNNAITRAASVATGPAADFLSSYKSFLGSLHNAASFDFAYKNAGKMPLPKLAAESRHLTGDPHIGGQFFRENTDRTGRTIRQEHEGVLAKSATQAVKGYGLLTELGRQGVPWWNITTQGMKRIGESYLENPARFVGKAYLYQALPAGALYSYTRGLGIDPHGRSYSDYMMNGRSEYAKLMNWYIPIPGKPAEEGMEVPRFHELAPVAHMMEVALDHISRSDVSQSAEDFMRQGLSLVGGKDFFPKDNAGAIFNPGEDTAAVGKSFYSAAIEPPTPPIANLILGSVGQVAPQGVFGGESYSKKQDPYDQLGGMNATSELMLRAVGTGIADIIGSGYAAYTQTPKGVLKGIENAVTEGSKRAIMKTPIVRDLLDIKPPETGNTRVTDELFKKEKVINNLSRYYRTWTKANGQINTKLASESGGAVVEKLLGNGPVTESAGIDQPTPTNPLYKMFMDEVYKKFNADADRDKKGHEVGGIGYKSLWRRYGDYTENLKRLRSINDGNYVTWQQQMDERPDELAYLQENHIDSSNLRSVRNFYETKRQEVARQILFTIRAVEEDFTKRLGQPFHIEDLDPYKATQLQGTVTEPQPTIPPWYDGSGIGSQ